MNKKILYALAASMMLAGAACTDKYTVQDEPTPPVPAEPEKPSVAIHLSPEQQKTSKRATTVAQEMFQALCADPDNAGKTVAFSPMAANTALCTAAQLNLAQAQADVNAIYGNYADVNTLYSSLRGTMAQLDEDVKLSFANNVFCSQNFFDSNITSSAIADELGLTVNIADIDKPQLSTRARVTAPWGKTTAEFGSGLLFKYADDARVSVGTTCYAVSLPMGNNGAYELVIAKAEPGVDINTVIASGDIFDPGNGRYNYKPFTVAIPENLSANADMSFADAIHALLVKYIPEYEATNISPLETELAFSASGNLTLTHEESGASGSTAVESRSWDGGYSSGFINVADGNCVVSVIEASTKTCLFMARIAKM